MLPVFLFAIALVATPEFASRLHKEALAAFQQSRFAESRQLYQQAAELWRMSGPAYRPHLAISLLNLGQTYQNTGDWSGAIDVYREAVNVDSSAFAMSRLGGALVAVGRVAEAEPLLKKALASQTAAAPDDPETASTMNNLALLYGQAGRWHEAEPLVQKAVEIFNRAQGSDSIETAMMLANLGSVHMQQGRPERAEPLFRRARLTYERTLGGEHPQLAMVLSQEGLLLLQQNKVSLATTQMKRAVEILRKVTGPDSLDTSIAESNLALAYQRANKKTQAAELLAHALKVQESIYKQPSRELAFTRSLIADLNAGQKKRPPRSNPEWPNVEKSLYPPGR